MGKKPLPPEFDWVTARVNCSMDKVFELLRIEAQKNVETARAMNVPCEFVAFHGGFSVVRKGFGELKAGAKFLASDSTITVENLKSEKAAMAGLTLSDDGECRLLVNGRELDRWQFLKRMLEPVLFATGDQI